MGAFSNTFSMGMGSSGKPLLQIPSGIYLSSLEGDFLVEIENDNILLAEME